MLACSNLARSVAGPHDAAVRLVDRGTPMLKASVVATVAVREGQDHCSTTERAGDLLEPYHRDLDRAEAGELGVLSVPAPSRPPLPGDLQPLHPPRRLHRLAHRRLGGPPGPSAGSASPKRKDPSSLPALLRMRHLEYVLRAFVDHYEEARPHQGLEQCMCRHRGLTGAPETGPALRRDRLGGVLHEYMREAA